MATMTTYQQSMYISTDGSAIADSMYSLFSKHDNRFSHESGTSIIRVNNKFNLKYTDDKHVQIIDPDNSEIVLKDYNMNLANGTLVWDCILIKNQNLFYLEVYNGNSGFLLIIDKINNKNYIAFQFSTTRPYRYVENTSVGIICVEDKADNTYVVKPLASYVLNFTDLFFTNICLATTSGDPAAYIQIPDFCSCSNVNFRSTISVNNKNYFAVGTNTLVEINS